MLNLLRCCCQTSMRRELFHPQHWRNVRSWTHSWINVPRNSTVEGERVVVESRVTQKLSETRNLADPHQRRVRIPHRNGSHDCGIYSNLCPHPTSTFLITQAIMENANPGRYHHQPQTQPLQKTMLRGCYLRLACATGIYQEKFSIIPYSYALAITGTSWGDSRKACNLLPSPCSHTHTASLFSALR